MHQQLTKLIEKMDDVEHVLRRLTDNRYLNDTQLISYLFDKQIKQFHDPRRIKQELRQKEFPPALIEQRIEQNDVDWYQLAKKDRVRKFDDALPTDPKEKNKQIRYLQYKGYAIDTIFEALS